MGEVHPAWGPAPRPSSEIATVVLSNGIKVPVQKRLVGLVKTLCEATLARGYDINRNTWGYAPRKVRGGSSWSSHAWGCAVDISSDRNPMGSKLITDMPPWLPEMWEACGWRWGGRWATRPDAMHYSYVGGPEHVAQDLTRARAYLTGAGAPAVPDRPPAPPAVGAYDPPLILRPVVADYVPAEGGLVLVADNGDTYAFFGAAYPGPRPGRRDHDPYVLEPVVDEMANPDGHGGWLLAASGAVYALGGAPYRGGVNGQDYFRGRVAACFKPGGADYLVVATSGEEYDPG